MRLAAAEAVLDLAGNVRGGGRVSVNGPVALANPNNGSLAVSLQSVVVTDPSLFETSASGTLRVEGPLAGGALIAGRIVLGSTEVQVPSSGFSGTSPIPEIRHIGEPAGVRATRARAGLLASGGNGNGGSDRAYPLNIEIDATNRVFVRGRGLDAELGGVLRVAGTTADIVPDGQFELIRGRLDILGRRLVLTEGRATLRGDLDPDLFLVAETDADEVTVRIEITGKASSPVITFLSEPDLPEDEVLARLLFGRGVESLSVLQAAQLASAVATLAGQGGGGVVSRLRESFGLDDLDVATDETGETSLRVGKYISDNVYTDATVGADGETEIDLNLDLTDSITVRGSVTSEGQTGIGIFVEKDY